MKFRKIILLFILIKISFSLSANEKIFEKQFVIDGKEIIKKVKLKQKTKYTSFGKPLYISIDEKITTVFFYDKNGLLLKYWYSCNDEELFCDTIDFDISKIKRTDSYREVRYLYDNQNRIINEEELETGRYNRYSYDDFGNIILKKSNSGNIIYEYDSKNRLIHLIFSTGEEEVYEYDSQNREILKKEIRSSDYCIFNYTLYSDDNLKREYRKIFYLKNDIILDYTDVYLYNKNNELIYSTFHSDIHMPEKTYKVYQCYYDYDNGELVHVKTISSEKEVNNYYENIVDNQEIVAIIYEEIQ
ncbi:MAG: hypothetical protein PUC37_04520 [Spirochaetales bacterium]|nr:hypothetical protein [Spirochaetales bacterium]